MVSVFIADSCNTFKCTVMWSLREGRGPGVMKRDLILDHWHIDLYADCNIIIIIIIMQTVIPFMVIIIIII